MAHIGMMFLVGNDMKVFIIWIDVNSLSIFLRTLPTAEDDYYRREGFVWREVP